MLDCFFPWMSFSNFTLKRQHFSLNMESGQFRCAALDDYWRGLLQYVLLQTYPEKPYELMENLDLSLGVTALLASHQWLNHQVATDSWNVYEASSGQKIRRISIWEVNNRQNAFMCCCCCYCCTPVTNMSIQHYCCPANTRPVHPWVSESSFLFWVSLQNKMCGKYFFG